MSSSKVVFVTGVSSGIGRATAGQFAKLGCKVFGSVRDIKKAQAIPGVELLDMDVRDDASVKQRTGPLQLYPCTGTKVANQ